MRISLDGDTAYRIATVALESGETIHVESGAMAMMSEGMKVSSSAPSGMISSAIRKQFGGESFFFAKYTAELFGAWVQVAPKFPGDIKAIPVHSSTPWIIQSGALLAFSEGVNISTKFAGVNNILMREGATVLQVSGQGTLLVCSYGALQDMDLPQGVSVIVDTGHLVGWESTCTSKVGLLGSVMQSQLTGESLVAKVSGPGHLLTQTRAELGLRDWLTPDRGQNSGS